MAESLWDRVRGLALAVEGLRLEPLELDVAAGWTRRTTLVHLRGRGLEGAGEDVSYEARHQVGLRELAGAPAFAAALAGRFDLEGFCAQLDRIELFPGAAPDEPARDHRRWAFESAALDLALRQAGSSLERALGRSLRPLTFVVSLGLGEPPDAGVVRAWLAAERGTFFKLDASPSWSAALCRELAATGSVACVDLKSYYRGTPVDQPVDRALIERVLEHFPGAVIEDAFVDARTLDLLLAHWDRLSWDAPIHRVDDLRSFPRTPRALNVKPSRLGTLARLSELYEHASSAGIALYGGGQFELGLGRGQAQLLAALFHPTAANDLAPVEYHAGGPRRGLPRSPLALAPAAGFRLAPSASPLAPEGPARSADPER